MAKKATSGSRSGGAKKASSSRAVAERRTSGGGRRSSDAGMGDAFIKLLQSPLAAELVAVAATAALAALAEHGFTTGGGSRGKRAGKAVKEAGKAAAAAVGPWLDSANAIVDMAARRTAARANGRIGFSPEAFLVLVRAVSPSAIWAARRSWPNRPVA